MTRTIKVEANVKFVLDTNKIDPDIGKYEIAAKIEECLENDRYGVAEYITANCIVLKVVEDG